MATLAKQGPVVAKQTSVAAQGDGLARAKAFWAGRTQRQRIYLGVGLGVTLAVLALFAELIANPDYKPLISGLEAADVQTIVSQLAAKKIPYKVGEDGGSISVPADEVEAARLEVASHDAPHSGRIGFEIFDKVSWGQTEFDEKVNYQRALEGELERTIQVMDNVKSARVHLVMATDSVFMDRERGAKASVTLRLRRGTLSREQIAAITRLVAGAVDELKPGDVTIVDADSSRSLSAGGGESAGSDELQQQLTRRLMETLTPIVGADRLHATVNVEYDNSSSEESQEKYDPNVSVPLNTQHSEEVTSGGGAVSGGVPGTSSNVPTGKTAAVPASTMPGQSSKSETTTYGVNRVTRHVVEPGGRIRRLTAAVVVDDAVDRKQEKGKWTETHRRRSVEDMKLIGEVAQAAVGFDSARGDVVSVQNIAFERAPQEDVPAANILDKTHRVVTENAAAVRYGALLVLFGLVYLLMVRPIQRRALAVSDVSPTLLPEVAQVGSLPAPQSQEDLAQRAVVLKKQLAESVRANPDSSSSAIRGWLQEDKV